MYRLSGFNLPFKVDTLLFTTVCPFTMLQEAANKRLSTDIYLGLLQGRHKDILTPEIIKCVSEKIFLKIHCVLLKVLSLQC